MILIPEQLFYDILTHTFNVFEEESTLPKEKQLLYRLFKDLKFERYNYYDQAINLFYRKVTDTRKINLTMGYDLERVLYPSIHIIVPSENGDIPIGQNSGYNEPEFDIESQTYIDTFSLHFDSQITLLITSDNMMEVTIIYHTLKSVFFSLQAHLELSGIRNSKLSGRDVVLMDEIAPSHMFQKSLEISFFYESSISSYFVDNFRTKWIVRAQALGCNTESGTESE